ncbi:LruC domain-containing protein [Hymenobacter sp. BT188]|uniref:LruC domain-containing protein n=1 Tax=Hymenobacter sp. BT188 TaxID=2763504 RepID=UPI0016512550|nr:LruC domain-containing protein [Hymenobacter sp. BT188]MBC6605550.1 LruC domain-containing protein [Hymenobacter sp. BT188]
MKNRPLQQKITWLFSAIALMLTFQSCSDKENIASPRTTSQASTQDIVVPPACQSVCLVAGQHNQVGTVDVALDGGDVLVTYNLTAPGLTLKEIHLDVFTSLQELRDEKKLSNGGAIPGKFTYKQTFKTGVTSYTVRIPAAQVPDINCFFIASHAALSNGETAWGGVCDNTSKGVSLANANQFPGNNWSVYFEFCKSRCSQEIDFTYAWEDINNTSPDQNDRDYNDLVVQSDVIKTPTQLTINFLTTARGAAYDHKFSFRIPKTGITSISGAASYTSDATYYYITVFESTKTALPGTGSDGFANTVAGQPCVPFATAQVTLNINGEFSYNPSKPYEPYITVYPSGSVNVGSSYDLYIWEVSNRDTYTVGGKVYPNGILISDDWRWPLERVSVNNPYSSFTSITDGFTYGWFNSPDPGYESETFNKAACL